MIPFGIPITIDPYLDPYSGVKTNGTIILNPIDYLRVKKSPNPDEVMRSIKILDLDAALAALRKSRKRALEHEIYPY